MSEGSQPGTSGEPALVELAAEGARMFARGEQSGKLRTKMERVVAVLGRIDSDDAEIGLTDLADDSEPAGTL